VAMEINKLILCDFAGAESTFTCTNLYTLKKIVQLYYKTTKLIKRPFDDYDSTITYNDDINFVLDSDYKKLLNQYNKKKEELTHIEWIEMNRKRKLPLTKKKIETEMKKYLKELSLLNYHHLRQVYKDCTQRNREGDMIRKSLIQFKFALRDFIMQQQQKHNTNSTSKFIEQQLLHSYCYNKININVPKILEPDSFNHTSTLNPNPNSSYKILFDEICPSTETKSTTFFSIGFIDLTDNIEKNNPDTIPYINLNKINYLLNLLNDNQEYFNTESARPKRQLIETLLKNNTEKLFTTLMKYNFYKYDDSIKSLMREIIMSLESPIQSTQIDNILANLARIHINNNSTLIGILEYLQSYHTLYNSNLICSYSNNDSKYLDLINLTNSNDSDDNKLYKQFNKQLDTYDEENHISKSAEISTIPDQHVSTIPDQMEQRQLDFKSQWFNNNPIPRPSKSPSNIGTVRWRGGSGPRSKQKYIKYKQKYLNLKNIIMNINI
jgi:hypothetical protein